MTLVQLQLSMIGGTLVPEVSAWVEAGRRPSDCRDVVQILAKAVVFETYDSCRLFNDLNQVCHHFLLQWNYDILIRI